MKCENENGGAGVRKSRIAHRQVMGPSFRTLIEAKDASILAHFSHPAGGAKMVSYIENPLHRLGPEERVVGVMGD